MKDTMMQQLASFHADEDGATATEYIILLVLIACFVIAVVKTFGATVSQKYTDANDIILKEVRF